MQDHLTPESAGVNDLHDIYTRLGQHDPDLARLVEDGPRDDDDRLDLLSADLDGYLAGADTSAWHDQEAVMECGFDDGDEGIDYYDELESRAVMDRYFRPRGGATRITAEEEQGLYGCGPGR